MPGRLLMVGMATRERGEEFIFDLSEWVAAEYKIRHPVEFPESMGPRSGALMRLLPLKFSPKAARKWLYEDVRRNALATIFFRRANTLAEAAVP
jgi:hypothetical protein